MSDLNVKYADKRNLSTFAWLLTKINYFCKEC